MLRSDVLMDIGRPINPGVDRGQLVGASIQGLGWVPSLAWSTVVESLRRHLLLHRRPPGHRRRGSRPRR